MIWKKTRITTNRYESGDYRITEDVEIHATPFRLESFADGADPEYFPSLDSAKRAATTRAELAASKDEIARLRAELDERRQADAFVRNATPSQSSAATKLAAELVDFVAANDAEHDEEESQLDMQDHAAYEADGRGIPRARARAGTINLHDAGPASTDDWF